MPAAHEVLKHFGDAASNLGEIYEISIAAKLM